MALEFLAIGAVLGGIGNCLAEAAGGKVVDGLAKFSSRHIARYTAHWSLPENEHVARPLRTAQYDALKSFLLDFTKWIDGSQSHTLDVSGERFLREATSYAARGRSSSGNLPDPQAKEIADKLEATLDKVLAGKTAAEQKARALVKAAESVVLTELRKAVGAAGGGQPPQVFVDAFSGRYEMLAGWHARFVHYWQQAIKENEPFRAIFSAQRLASIAEGIEELKQGQTAIREDISSMKAELLAAMSQRQGIPPDHLRPLFDAVGSEVPAERFEEAIRAAVDALVAKAADKAAPMNDPAAVVAAIDAARAKLKTLDIEGALGLLDREIENQESQRIAAARGEARLYSERADILSKAYRWNEALAAHARAARAEPDDPWHHFCAGNIHVHQGRLDAALRDYSFGLGVAKRVGDERNEGVGACFLGNVFFSKGKLEDALRHFEVYRKVSEKLAAGDATNSQWQRDLSVSHNKIGDVRRAQGDLSGALQAYEAGLAICQKLAAGDATNSKRQRDLSACHNRIGDVRRAQGDLSGALRAYEAGLTIRQKLAAGDATNSEWQYDLFVSLWRIGHHGDGDLGALERALSVIEKLDREGKLAPVNAQWVEMTRQAVAAMKARKGK
jgi:tetratricopeptide (TPR) repeat protein